MIIGIVAAIYLVLTAAGSLWTDFLWFDSVGYEGIWVKNLGVSTLLGVVGVVIAFAVIWGSLRLADRMSPRWVPFDLTEEEELIERFRDWVEPRIRIVRLLVSLGLALLLGLAAASWRDDFFLFQNGKEFGVADPIFGSDLSFFMFRLPLWNTALDWVFNLSLLSLVAVAVVHYFNGGIRLSGRGLSVTSGTKTHILGMLAILALIRAAIYRLDMSAPRPPARRLDRRAAPRPGSPTTRRRRPAGEFDGSRWWGGSSRSLTRGTSRDRLRVHLPSRPPLIDDVVGVHTRHR
jgi:uncharacterized membrane protein (UPF0182 family)